MACDRQSVPDSISRWWWYVVLYFIFAVPLFTPLATGDRNILLFIGTFVFATAFPLLALCLYIDARKIKASDATWTPNPYIYGVFGVIHGLSGGGYLWIEILFRFELLSNIWESISSMHVRYAVAIVSAVTIVLYLVQRFRYVGLR